MFTTANAIRNEPVFSQKRLNSNLNNEQLVVSSKWICTNYSSTTVSKFVEENNSFNTLARLPGHWTPSVLVQNDGLGQFTLHSTYLKHLNKCLKTNRSVYITCA